MCVCSFRYPAYSAHAPYCDLWPVQLYDIFPQRHDFFGGGEVFGYKMCVLIFSTTFVWNISHSKKNWARYDQKTYIGLHVKYPSLLSDCNENWTISTDFRTIPKYQISWKSGQWQPSCPTRTEGPTDTTKRSRFSSSLYLSWSWATCRPVPVSRVHRSLQRSTMIPSASWGIAFFFAIVPTRPKMSIKHLLRTFWAVY